MTKLLLILALTASGLLLTSTAYSESKTGVVIGSKKIKFPAWIKDSFLEIQEDAKEAKQENKHIILYFHSVGCPYCAQMMHDSFVNAPFENFIKTNFSLIEINLRGTRQVEFDQNTSLSEKELAKKLGVFTIPMILFLDETGKIVARVNGYWSPTDFKLMLDYVHGKHYQTMSFIQYRDQNQQLSGYRLLSHQSFIKTNDLSSLKGKPVALLFEDNSCLLCTQFHQNVLAKPEIKKALEGLHVVQLDAKSNQVIIGFDGLETTAKKLADKLKLYYRPGIVFFNNGVEITRKTGMMKTFHSLMLFRFVAEKQYLKYKSRSAFARAERAKILASGKNINVWD